GCFPRRPSPAVRHLYYKGRSPLGQGTGEEDAFSPYTLPAWVHAFQRATSVLAYGSTCSGRLWPSERHVEHLQGVRGEGLRLTFGNRESRAQGSTRYRPQTVPTRQPQPSSSPAQSRTAPARHPTHTSG